MARKLNTGPSMDSKNSETKKDVDWSRVLTKCWNILSLRKDHMMLVIINAKRNLLL